jgi:hypothetical protein
MCEYTAATVQLAMKDSSKIDWNDSISGKESIFIDCDSHPLSICLVFSPGSARAMIAVLETALHDLDIQEQESRRDAPVRECPRCGEHHF